MSLGARISEDSSDRAPRLLILTPDFPPARGGIQLLTSRLASGLAERFPTRVVTLDQPEAERFDATCGVPVRRVRRRGAGSAARVAALNVGALREALGWRPQLVLSAHIVTSPSAAVLRRVLGARVVQYFYGKEIGDKPRLAAFAARRADAAISISSYTSKLLEERAASPRTLRLIAPGVDLPELADPLEADRPTFLTVSRLADRYKGHDVLVRALAIVRDRVPDVEWVVIGDGPLRAEIEQLAHSVGVAGSIRFLGSVSDEQRNRWLRRTDLLAMPSRLPEGRRAGEGFGIVYLEAGSYGKPVLAGNVAGALDAVIDGQTGLLVDPADPVAVGEGIVRLLLDRDLAARLGAAAARRSQDFAWPRVVERVEALLRETMLL